MYPKPALSLSTYKQGKIILDNTKQVCYNSNMKLLERYIVLKNYKERIEAKLEAMKEELLQNADSATKHEVQYDGQKYNISVVTTNRVKSINYEAILEALPKELKSKAIDIVYNVNPEAYKRYIIDPKYRTILEDIVQPTEEANQQILSQFVNEGIVPHEVVANTVEITSTNTIRVTKAN